MLQKICDALQPGTISVFFQRWLARLPLPLGAADHDAGYWWELSMAQVEVSRTIVFTQPRYARAFFEALVTDNLDLGRPDTVEIIFGRRIVNGRQRATQGTFKTKVITRGTEVTINAFYRRSRIKQYLNCDMRSHAASGCVERRAGLCRGRSPGQRRKTCPRRDVRAGLLGWRVRSSRESPRVPDPSGGHRRGEGRAGVNASELLRMPR